MFATDWKQLRIVFLSITINIMKFILPSVRPQIKTDTCMVNLPSVSRKSAIGPNKLSLNQAGNLCQTWPRLICIGDSRLLPGPAAALVYEPSKSSGLSALKCQLPLLSFSLLAWFCVLVVWQQASLLCVIFCHKFWSSLSHI